MDISYSKPGFCYDDYKKLICLLKDSGYCFSNYVNYNEFKAAVIMRHDIDYDLDYAVVFAELDSLCGITSTYFIETTSEFYNIFAKSEKAKLKKILSLGHDIGLHFDRTQYGNDFNCFSLGYDEKVKEEIQLLESVIDQKVNVMSLHEPLKSEINSDFKIDGIVNAYSKEFFENFKYYSDSSMNWRENVTEGITKKTYPRIQILTHPFWYSDTNSNVRQMLLRFINGGNLCRYNKAKLICGFLSDYVNDTDIEGFVRKSE